jgi:hypothetical protein
MTTMARNQGETALSQNPAFRRLRPGATAAALRCIGAMLLLLLLALPMSASPSLAQVETCPSGERWNGERCVRGVTLLPLPRDGCQRGYWRTGGRCCRLGDAWNGSRCAPDAQAKKTPECPFGTSGAYPNCMASTSAGCPDGWSGRPPVCCAPELRFSDGRCVKPDEIAANDECGPGRYLSDGHCCARGTVWNGKRCLRNAGVQPSCPRGQVGIFPDCKEPGSPVLRQPCPSGTTGTFPNCVTAQRCPSGMVGAPPNCRTIEARTCPAGTRGRYPNCAPIARVCPPGTTGVPPVCRRIGNRPCPAGTVGSPGRCVVLQPARPLAQPRPIQRPVISPNRPRR